MSINVDREISDVQDLEVGGSTYPTLRSIRAVVHYYRMMPQADTENA